MLGLFLFDAGYFFGGVASFFFKAALALASLVLLIEFLRSRRQPAAQSAPNESSGCTMVLVFVVGFLLLICLLFLWIGS